MIDTIIFDIGNVLVPFNWREVYSDIFDAATAEAVGRATVMDAETWNEFDRGCLSDGELFARFYSNAPEYREQIDFGVWEIYRRMKPYGYSTGWIKSLKGNGYKVYLLSNFGKTPFETACKSFDFINDVDGGIISYEVRDVKPNPSIFKILCAKYNIEPQNAVFIDDNAANVEAAGALGFGTVLFTDYSDACQRLGALGVIL